MRVGERIASGTTRTGPAAAAWLLFVSFVNVEMGVFTVKEAAPTAHVLCEQMMIAITMNDNEGNSHVSSSFTV